MLQPRASSPAATSTPATEGLLPATRSNTGWRWRAPSHSPRPSPGADESHCELVTPSSAPLGVVMGLPLSNENPVAERPCSQSSPLRLALVGFQGLILTWASETCNA